MNHQDMMHIPVDQMDEDQILTAHDMALDEMEQAEQSEYRQAMQSRWSEINNEIARRSWDY